MYRASETVDKVPLQFGQEDPLDFGWGKFSSKLEILLTPGNHFSLFNEPNVSVLGDHLRQYMSRLYN